MISARPFLKWAGGKSRLLHEILPRLPASIDTYWEPFIGGGAVFFALAAARRFKRARIGDSNSELVTAYGVVRDNAEALIEALLAHAARRLDPDYYYGVRAFEPTDRIERAARLIFLNKTCFNGLYRVNKKGAFNVPFGRYKNPLVCDADNLRRCSLALKNVEIVEGDFTDANFVHASGSHRDVLGLKPGDAFYFDPPYPPLSPTSSFTAYTQGGFGIEDHKRLKVTFSDLVRRGVEGVLSNADCAFTRELYSDHSAGILNVQAARAINSKGAGRGAISELLIAGPV